MPWGMGRHGLFSRSSFTESGVRWLARSKMRRLDQLKIRTRGRRVRIERREGAEVVVRVELVRAPQMPKTVLGRTKVGKSLSVKSQRMLRRF